MLKIRKKSISLIVVLTFIMTLFPLALPAFAVDYSRIGAVKVVSDEDYADLNAVKVELDAGDLEVGDVVILKLPEDFEFDVFDADGLVENLPRNWVDGFGSDVYYGTDTNSFQVYIPRGGDNYLDVNNPDPFDVEVLDENEIKITAKEHAVSLIDDGYFYIYLKNTWVPEGYEGDIPLKFDAPSGSGFEDAEVVVGRVTGGEVEIDVTDSETFSDYGEVTFRLVEDMKGALERDDESVKLILPDGFVWDDDIEGALGAGFSNNMGSKFIYGEGLSGSIKVDPDDESELIIDVDSESSKATCIEIKAVIKVDDETDAKKGDIVAKVKGESDVTPSTVVVGAYGDYAFDVTGDDPETVYAGQTEQAIADFTIEEQIKETFINNRTLTLTLPDWAVWGALPDEIKDSKVTLTLESFPGKDGHTAKYKVTAGTGSAAELEFEDMEVCLSPEAPEGDLVIELGGTCGIDEEITVAQVKKPFIMEVTQSPTIVIGRADQAIAEITLTEAEAGLFRELKGDETTGPVIIELPKDIEWEDFDVEVIEGDLEIGEVDAEDNYLVFEIEDESNDPSTIKITGTVTAYRTVPEGKVMAEVWGEPVIAVHDYDALRDQYDTFDGSYFEIEGLDCVKADNFYYGYISYYDTIFGDEGPIAEDEVAYVGTPAPSEQHIKAVFTLGSTEWSLNGVAQTMDVAPYAKDGRTYLPMRYVAKALGIKDGGILWKNGTATFVSGDRVVSVTIGSKVMYINGAAVPIDAAPEIVNGRTMLPIRWIATAFGVDVTWDAAAQTVTVE